MTPLTPTKPGDESLSHALSQERGPHVPEALIHKLHEATLRFQKARGHLEQTMEGFDHRHVERVTQGENEILEAERELEEIDKEIQASLEQKVSH